MRGEEKGRDGTFAIEELATVLAGEGYALWNLAHELHDLRDVVVVLAITGASGRVEKVVTTCDEFECLRRVGLGTATRVSRMYTPRMPRSRCRRLFPTWHRG